MIGRHVHIEIQLPNVAPEYEVSHHFFNLLRENIRHPTLLPFGNHHETLVFTRTAS